MNDTLVTKVPLIKINIQFTMLLNRLEHNKYSV